MKMNVHQVMHCLTAILGLLYSLVSVNFANLRQRTCNNVDVFILLVGPYAQSNTDMVLKRHKTRLVNQQLKAKVISELDGRCFFTAFHEELLLFKENGLVIEIPSVIASKLNWKWNRLKIHFLWSTCTRLCYG